MMRDPMAAELATLLTAKRGLLVNLLGGLQNAKACLMQEDAAGFDAEMDAAGEITRAVDALTEAEVRLKQSLPRNLQDAEINSLESTIFLTISQLVIAQKECSEEARTKLAYYADQIKSVRGTQKGIRGYSEQFQPKDAIFFDEKK